MRAAWSIGTDTTYTRRRDVMGQSFSLGRISGIRIGVNWSVLIIVALLASGLGAGGCQVEGITLWLRGGVSRLQGEMPNPGAEVRVAGVGPLTSLVLGGVFTLVAWLLHASGVGGVVGAGLAWLGGVSILLAVFNVIPAAPLDGGRLLRAVLWAITGDRLKAAIWSARSGQVFGWI